MQAFVDGAWSAALLAALAYVLRHEIIPVIEKVRADAAARRVEVEAEAERVRNHRSFLTYLREKGIEPTIHDLGMEA